MYTNKHNLSIDDRKLPILPSPPPEPNMFIFDYAQSRMPTHSRQNEQRECRCVRFSVSGNLYILLFCLCHAMPCRAMRFYYCCFCFHVSINVRLLLFVFVFICCCCCCRFSHCCSTDMMNISINKGCDANKNANGTIYRQDIKWMCRFVCAYMCVYVK